MAEKKFSLDRYKSKRDFGKTPEPAPDAVDSGAEAAVEGPFVIHRHEARNLHYDLRLGMEGVLKSWAVPKGFSWVPEHKHLAVRTEDHPWEYLEFDGTIPKGQYGAGSMTIWDTGTFRMVKGADGLAGLDDGKLEFELLGGRVRGQWHMVRLAKSDKDWLLFKYKDRYAREEGEPTFPLDLSRVKPAAFPRAPKVMRPAKERGPFSDPAWAYELEFAGRRTLVAWRDDRVKFLKPDGKAMNVDAPAVEAAVRRLRTRTALLDGVLVAADDADRPDRALLERKLKAGDTADLRLYVFDLLHYEDWDLKKIGLLRRKEALASLLPASDALLYVDHVVERGEELAEVVARGGLPGVIAKRTDSAYKAGAGADWAAVPSGAEAADAAGSVLDGLADAPVRKSRVKFSNRTKVYWPEEGITKGELLDWYDGMADVLVPYLRDRPVHMLRYPDGIHGKSFYHKNVTGRIPDWVRTAKIKEEDGEEVRYVVCNDRDTLLQLVNLGSIDLHPWLSRVDDPLKPDWAIVDLDPSDDDFSKPVRIARTVGKILHGAGLRPLLKTSGKTGLHIYVPLVRKYTYEQVRMFCEVVARMAVIEHKKIATVERTPAKRGSRVYVDFGQNRREQTVVPPYVVRPVPGATVSCPLDWDELSGRLHPSDFDLRTVPERLEQFGDLFRGTLQDLQELEPAIASLDQR